MFTPTSIQRLLVIVLLSALFPSASFSASAYMFRIYLSDKTESTSAAPLLQTSLLSEQALARRAKYQIPLDQTDEQLSSTYLKALEAKGVQIVVRSKWFNTVVVALSDSIAIDKVKACSFVDSVQWVWKGQRDTLVRLEEAKTKRYAVDTPLKSTYGYAEKQITLHRGDRLHQAGFCGEGINVAVIDAGFESVDQIAAFDSLKLKGTYNFINPARSVFYEDDHGTKVLSCMAANLPKVMVGTAPEANYWLLKSEDTRSEYPVEEDYWIAAVEYADSVGVDIITSSLGYFEFDSDQLEYPKSALNGITALISRAATLAAQKGILLFSSAGNEGRGSWGTITFPADASSIITVGAIDEKKKVSSFSSQGLTADQRIKPDIVAMGTSSCVINTQGGISFSDGTSFSTPIFAGLAVCLWQALPKLSNLEMIKLIQQMGHQYKDPDAALGYGIPDVYKAYKRNIRAQKKSN